MEDCLKEQIFSKKLSVAQAQLLNPLVLAFVGDAVYSLYVKTEKLDLTLGKVNKFNEQTKQMVNAQAQADKLNKIKDVLTDEESSIARRARNANIHSHAKNFSIDEYRHATSFEAVIGFLFITDQIKRLIEILNLAEGA